MNRAPTMVRPAANWETGDRMIGWGIQFQVTGDGHELREFRSRPQDPDCRGLKCRFLKG